MRILTGPAASGKRAYAIRALGFREGDIASGVLDERPVLRDLPGLVSACLKEGRDPESLLPLLEKKELLLIDEIGGGLVPPDPFERELRERTGRLACLLAERADTVIRMTCGIPAVIKEEK